MADIAQAVVTGGMSMAGVAIGVGLNHWLSALNRRHQEDREDKTHLYEARFQAYAQLSQAALTRSVIDPRTSPNAEERLSQAMMSATTAMGAIALVGSDEVLIAANKLVVTVGDEIERRE